MPVSSLPLPKTQLKISARQQSAGQHDLYSSSTAVTTVALLYFKRNTSSSLGLITTGCTRIPAAESPRKEAPIVAPRAAPRPFPTAAPTEVPTAGKFQL